MARLLLIEDDANTRRVLYLALAGLGHHVVTAVDGGKGLRAARAEEFDLVITDLIMPEKEGIETIIELRRLQPDLRIIAVSGGPTAPMQQSNLAAAHLGAMATLAKPFTVETLAETVARVLATPVPAAAAKPSKD